MTLENLSEDIAQAKTGGAKTTKPLFARPLICLLLSALVCALWGSLYTCIRYGYLAFGIDGKSDIPSILLFAGIRFLICGGILVAFLTCKEKKLRLPGKQSILPIFLIAFLTVILHYSLTYIGLATTDGGKTSVLKQVGYLVISCFAFLFYKEDRFTLQKLFGGILGFGSIVVMNLDGSGLHFSLGDLLIIVASFCSAGGNIVSKKTYRYESPVYIVAWSQFIGGLILTIAGLIFGGRFHAFGWDGVAILTYICAASIIAYCLWNLLLKHNPLSLMSIYKFMEPLFGVLVSAGVTAILYHENALDLKYIPALLLLLLGIIIGNLHFARKTESN